MDNFFSLDACSRPMCISTQNFVPTNHLCPRPVFRSAGKPLCRLAAGSTSITSLALDIGMNPTTRKILKDSKRRKSYGSLRQKSRGGGPRRLDCVLQTLCCFRSIQNHSLIHKTCFAFFLPIADDKQMTLKVIICCRSRGVI